jgi:hypothetical protein
MQAVILSIWILHGVLMIFDEFYYHHRRGLGRWESMGHPVDTLFFLACFIYALFADSANVGGFVALAVLSTLIITKDEFVHAKLCPGTEHWLHALLFAIHPVSLYALYLAWTNGLVVLITLQTILIVLFGTYQVIYWNLMKADKYTCQIQKQTSPR